jgi:two-component system CheB/CheR fusion protein
MQAVHPDDQERARTLWAEALVTGEPVELEYRLRAADGSYQWFLSRAVPLIDEAGRVGKWFGTSTNIERQKQAETALREADRQKNHFLAMLAHELRNPLAPVLHAVEILRLRGPEDPVVRQQRDVIERQIRQMKRLLDDLLDVARITRGTMQLVKAPLDLRTVLDQAVETSRPILDAKQHGLTVVGPAEPLPLEGDGIRLTQVLTNLLNNAAKYTDPGGHVWLTAAADGGTVVVRVRDTGVGMGPELLARAFDLFAQGDQSLDRSQGGLGIGLTLVKRLVELHGGTVAAHSDGPGKGCEFTVRLPLQTAAAPVAEPSRPAATPVKPRRILVVDDNADAAESLALVLRLWQHEAATAHDGPAALKLAETFRPEVVFLDIGLPRMNGYQVARELRKLRGLEKVLLVAMTGYGQDEDRRRAREAGFDHHLVKPVDMGAVEGILADGSPG